ncbi:hypothetical protein EDD29_1095 [Actinocorallia herbida]|uniref:Uncharacterized protein n=1 Tax=Actinocorallia herbida TaxID=58109 RepID=A0A3N1CQL6_9ACTN|nr:hypothetical protein [Actinocorallia herbida]ROO83589.1 hypothetical protein EDD29_1095 [Actinocorallia herbida]
MRIRAALALTAATLLVLPAGAAEAAPKWTTILKDPSIEWVQHLHATGNRSLWAFLSVTDGAGGAKTVARHWNGTKWRTVPLPLPGGWIEFADSAAPDDVWATVGKEWDRADTVNAIIHWDGTRWSTVRTFGEHGASDVVALGGGAAQTSVYGKNGARILTYRKGAWTGKTVKGLSLGTVAQSGKPYSWALGGKVDKDENDVYRRVGDRWRRQQPPLSLLRIATAECLRLWPGLPRSECPVGEPTELVVNGPKNVLLLVNYTGPTPSTRVLRWNGKKWSIVGHVWKYYAGRVTPDGKGGFWAVDIDDPERLLRFRDGELTKVALPKGVTRVDHLSPTPSGRLYATAGDDYGSNSVIRFLTGVR